jgi:hypothetical protein
MVITTHGRIIKKPIKFTFPLELNTEVSVKSKLTNNTGYSGKKWDNAIKWVKKETDDCITYIALKYIPNAKIGETSYEFAFYEEANRRNAICGRGLVGMHLFEADIVSATSRNELLELFPIDNPQILATFNTKFNLFEDYVNNEISDEDKFEEYEDKYDITLFEAITCLINGSGFKEVNI